MKILVTGADGFIGKNLRCHLKENGYETLPYDLSNTIDELRAFLSEADFIVHLAGVNRPLKEEEFLDGNVNFTKRLLDEIAKSGKKIPLFFSSSTQAEKDNPYGRSKKMAEDQILSFSKDTGNPCYVYRLYNVYGKWCRPSYNSVIATWCDALTHGKEIQINEENPAIDFVYVDDVCEEILSLIEGGAPANQGIHYVETHDRAHLKEIASWLSSFAESRANHFVPEIETPFKRKLYATFLSYYGEGDFAYPLDTHSDQRGSFTEILKTLGDGQFSVNVIDPGVTKGNHYHHTKNEKFLVVEGECVTSFRKITEREVVDYRTNGDELKAIDIPPGYTHSITNVGNSKAIVFMWASESFDPLHPDTYPLPVLEE